MAVEQNNPASDDSDNLSALERFVVDNNDLLQLESSIGRFNIFDALGITHYEIRHSNFLAFILDPAESHGQGDLFLKALLIDMLKGAPTEFRLSPIELDGTNLRGVEVKREWRNIDLLITCQEPPFAIVIENKVLSGEHSDQLDHYKLTTDQQFAELRDQILYIYLTPDGARPSHDSWRPWSYTRIYQVLKWVRDFHKNSIEDDFLVFLNHYLELLGTRFMNDERLDELCRRIYKNHRQALELIWDRVESEETMVLRELTSIMKQDNRWHILSAIRSYVEFVPSAWVQWLPRMDGKNYAVCVQIWVEERMLRFTVFLGPMNDPVKRSKTVTMLRDESPKHQFKRTQSIRTEGTWSQICGSETILEWDKGNGPGTDEIRNMLDELYSRLEPFRLVLKSSLIQDA